MCLANNSFMQQSGAGSSWLYYILSPGWHIHSERIGSGHPACHSSSDGYRPAARRHIGPLPTVTALSHKARGLQGKPNIAQSRLKRRSRKIQIVTEITNKTRKDKLERHDHYLTLLES